MNHEPILLKLLTFQNMIHVSCLLIISLRLGLEELRSKRRYNLSTVTT